MSFDFLYISQKPYNLLFLLKSSILLAAFIGLFIVLTPNTTLLSATLGHYDEKRLLQLLILVVLCLALWLSDQTRANWLISFRNLPNITRYGTALIFAAGLTSALLAPSPGHALLEVSLFFMLFCLFISFAHLCKTFDKTLNKAILITITVSVSLYLVSFFSGYFAAITQAAPFVQRELFGGFSNIRFFNQYQSWTLPLIVLPALLLPVQTRSLRFLLCGVAMGWWTLLLASAGRGTLLGIVTAAIVVAVIYRKHALTWLALQAQAFAGGAFIYWLLFHVVMRPDVSIMNRATQFTHDPARIELWRKALLMIAENPLFGVGPMHYAFYPNGIAAHPHNALLQWAAEWGVPATLLLLGLLVWGFIAWSRQSLKIMKIMNDPHQNLLRVAITASLITGATHAMVSGIIVMPLSQILMVVIAGWALGLYQSASPSAVAHYSRGSILMFRLVLAAALVFLVWGTLPEILELYSGEAFLSDATTGHYQPRFWQQGIIGIHHGN